MSTSTFTVGDRRRRSIAAGFSSLVVLAALTACQTPQQKVTEHEDKLAAAGFVVKPADTPEREAMLKRLPPNKFAQRSRGGTVTFVYADPLVCNCLYVGSQQAYNQFKQQQQQQHLADEQQMTAAMYSDPNWNWGGWGTWNPAFGFGYGAGW